MPVGRHLQLVATGAGAITHDRLRPATSVDLDLVPQAGYPTRARYLIPAMKRR